MKKEYTYDEWLNLSREIKDWTTRISRWDNRPYHPEDYVGYAEELLKKANNNQVIAWALFLKEFVASLIMLSVILMECTHSWIFGSIL
jgi:hypothetical protein